MNFNNWDKDIKIYLDKSAPLNERFRVMLKMLELEYSASRYPNEDLERSKRDCEERFRKNPKAAIQYLEDSMQAFEISRKIFDDAKAKKNEEKRAEEEKQEKARRKDEEIESLAEGISVGLVKYDIWKRNQKL